MNDKQLELIIMLNGNFCVIPAKQSEIDNIKSILIGSIKDGIKDPYSYLDYGGYTVMSKDIVGFYFRTPHVSATEKAVKILEKMDSNGDEWKSEE